MKSSINPVLTVLILNMCLINAESPGLIQKVKNLYYAERQKSEVMYSHGFGDSPEEGRDYTELFKDAIYSAPQYENTLSQASFYTQESQRKLLQSLVDRIKTAGSSTINLFVGRSMGGGTAINLFDKLINYEQNKEFFEGTDIKSSEDAQEILNAINKGKVIFTAPALSMLETTAIRMPSSFLSAVTFACLTAGAYYLWSWYAKKKEADQEQELVESVDSDQAAKTKQTKEIFVKLGILALGGAAWYLLADKVSAGYANIISRALPWATGGHFNPADTEPGEALKRIVSSEKYTAPTLWHFNKGDEVLHHPEEKIKKLFEQKNPYHEVIFTDDAFHNTISRQYIEKVKEFHKK